MRISYIIFQIMIFLPLVGLSQSAICDIKKNELGNAYLVDAKAILCLAKNADEERTLFYTFASWCKPCIEHLPDLVALSIVHDININFVLIDKENNIRVKWATDILSNYKRVIKENYEQDFKYNILVLKDETGRRKKNYLKFLTEITPPQFEVINDMGKHIVIDKSGEVLLVTSYKDKTENNELDDAGILKEKVLPLLKIE